MLTVKTRAATVPALVIAALLVAGIGSAQADPGDPGPSSGPVTPPGDDGSGGASWGTTLGAQTPGAGGGASPGGGGSSGGCVAPVVEGAPPLPYSCERGCWYSDYTAPTPEGGYFQQPSMDHPYDGHTDGRVVACYASVANGSVRRTGGRAMPWWTASGGVVVDPAQLAQQAVEQMGLRVPAIGMTGGEPPDGMQIVGMPAWLWAADPGESTTPGVGGIGTITRSASAGGVTVTATGRLDRTVWSLGDGATVTCSGARAAGTPYEGRYDKQPSPTCGHTYTRTSAGQPNEAFTVTVTAYWVVDWSGGGQTGTINVQRSRNTPKQVGELQALVVGREGKG